jgi:hypothetical protein
MGHKIESHEKKKDRHGEAGEDFCSLKSGKKVSKQETCSLEVPNLPKRMSYTRALPHLKVAEDVHNNTQCSTYGIKEYQVGECCQRQGSLGTVQYVCCYERMAQTPDYPDCLFFRHAIPCFFECWYGKGSGKCQWCSWRRFEKDLMLC